MTYWRTWMFLILVLVVFTAASGAAPIFVALAMLIGVSGYVVLTIGHHHR